MTLRFSPVASLWLILLPLSLRAQTIEGRMVQQTDATPVAGAFVVLTDSTGQELARAMTDAQGRFILAAPAPGRYRLKSAVIGWRAMLTPSLSLDADTKLHYTFVVRPHPVRLGAVVVTGESRCTAAADRNNAAVVAVWEEARKALSAVSWTRRAVPLRFRWVRYERNLDPQSLRVLADTSWEAAGVSARGPFGTPAPDSLHAFGFVRRLESGEWLFESPDADVLLSDAFAAAHCFEVRAHGHDDALIGLGFGPDKGRNVPEISGSIWLDRHSGELRSLEFRFVQLPWDVPNDNLGGRVEFQRLPTGAWIVRRWWIRMPALEIHLGARYGRVRTAEHLRVAHIIEEGALVTEIRHADGATVTLGAPAAVTGVVFDSLRGSPMRDAEVALHGTPYHARTDDSGRFAIRAVPSGTYVLGFRHPDLSRAPPVVASREIVVLPGDTLGLWLGVPARESLWRLYCPDAPATDSVGLIMGVVTLPVSGEPAVGATVAARWERWMLGADPVAAGERVVITAVTGPGGVYAVCGVPAGAGVELRVSSGEVESPPVTVRLGPGEVVRVDFELGAER